MQFTRILRTFVMATGLLGALGVGSASAYLLDPAGLGQTRAPLATSTVPELSALPSTSTVPTVPTVPAGLSDLPALPLVGDPTDAVPTIPGLPVPVAQHTGVLESSGRSAVYLLDADLPATRAAGHALPDVGLPVTPPSVSGTTGAVMAGGDTPGAVLPDLDVTGSDLAGLPNLAGIAAGHGA